MYSILLKFYLIKTDVFKRSESWTSKCTGKSCPGVTELSPLCESRSIPGGSTSPLLEKTGIIVDPWHSSPPRFVSRKKHSTTEWKTMEKCSSAELRIATECGERNGNWKILGVLANCIGLLDLLVLHTVWEPLRRRGTNFLFGFGTRSEPGCWKRSRLFYSFILGRQWLHAIFWVTDRGGIL